MNPLFHLVFLYSHFLLSICNLLYFLYGYSYNANHPMGVYHINLKEKTSTHETVEFLINTKSKILWGKLISLQRKYETSS